MNPSLYNKTITCPVCSEKFEVTKVRSKTSRVDKRDSDFCIHYIGVNPILYDAWVCENCGYSAQPDKFDDINEGNKQLILKNIKPRWTKRSFSGERSLEMSLEAYKLALVNLKIRQAKASDMAKVCIRIAWVFRFMKNEKEKEFLQFALNCYEETYNKENFPVDKLDEATCMYMVAELYRRTENFETAKTWFSRLITSPEARKNQNLIDSARAQFQLAKDHICD